MKKLIIVNVPDGNILQNRITSVDTEGWIVGHDYTEIEFTSAEVNYLLTLHRMNEQGKYYAPVEDVEDKLKQLL